MLIPIGLPADPRLEDYRDLKDRDRQRGGRFLAEGEVVVRMLLRHADRFPVRSLLVLDRHAGKLAGEIDPALPVYVAPAEVLEAVVGFHLHRGFLASAERPAGVPAAALLDRAGPGPVVVLEGLTNHDNVGGVFRNAAGLGAAAVLLDPGCCDPLYRKALRVAVGTTLATPYAHLPLPEALALLRARGYTVVALTPAPDAVPIGEVRPAGPVALLLGTEGPGLSAGARAAADVAARIPMAPGIDSLNVATACAVALYALR